MTLPNSIEKRNLYISLSQKKKKKKKKNQKKKNPKKKLCYKDTYNQEKI